MLTQKNISLLPYNSFHLEVNAAEFVSVKTVDELAGTCISVTKTPLLILGGGSNILLTKNVEGLVLKIDIGGIEEVKEDQHMYMSGRGRGRTGMSLYNIR